MSLADQLADTANAIASSAARNDQASLKALGNLMDRLISDVRALEVAAATPAKETQNTKTE